MRKGNTDSSEQRTKAICPGLVCTQIENEYGFCGSDKAYLRHLVGLARRCLGDDVILFTTGKGARAGLGVAPRSCTRTCTPGSAHHADRCSFLP